MRTTESTPRRLSATLGTSRSALCEAVRQLARAHLLDIARNLEKLQ
ncbi:hypothetical protein ACFYVR_24110 [Rhodococcus sp. NPDC003318]